MIDSQLIVHSDGTCFAGGYYDEHGKWHQRQTTYEEWEATYGEQIERAQRLDPKRIFITSINTRLPASNDD